MAKKYLDDVGLDALWGKIKSFFTKGNGRVFVGTCETADATETKEVICPSFSESDLVTGTIISVFFTATNSAAVKKIKLDVNNTGAKSIKYIVNGSLSDIPSAAYLKANQIYHFTYDGTYWVVQMVYDSNTNTIAYNIRPHQVLGVLHSALTRYGIMFTMKDGELLPSYSGSYTTNTTKTLTTQPFNPFGLIYYYTTTTAVSAGAAPSVSYVYTQYYAVDLRYGFNTGSTLEEQKPVYIRCIPQSNGTVVLDGDNCITQSLPESEDNKYYILLGWAYNTTSIVLFNTHYIYMYKNNAPQIITEYAKNAGNAETVNGHTVNINVPSDAIFTDTVTTATTTGEGNAVTSITASNGALTITKGTTFLTEHQDISGKADKTTTVTDIAYDSTNKKITKTINGSTTDVVTTNTLKTAMELDGAEPNQNAFSNVKVGNTTISADTTTDTLELTAGNNITLTPDTTNDKVTIAATDTTYSAGTGLSLSETTFSNSGVTGIKGDNENSYRTGQVNLTPLNIGAIAKSDELQTTNPFAPNSLKGMYISKIDNGFYAADKRWIIDGLTAWEASVIFNGNYESKITITKETSKTFTIDFENSEIDVSPYNNVNCMAGYPYGNILLSFYNASVPESVSGRIYCNYEPHGIGWHDISFIPASDNTTNACVYRGRQGCYAISKLEITINAGANTNAELTQVEMHLDRPDSQRTPFLSKYTPETLYYNLTAPKFIGDVAASTVNATTKVTTPIVETGNTTPSYFQTERLRGEGNASTYYHAIDFGKSGHNQVDFYEYGGVFNFHKHTGATIDAGDTLLGTINNKGWDGKVNNHTINADVPANAVFTDTTYESKTGVEDGTDLSLVTTGEKYLWNSAASGGASVAWSNVTGKPTVTGNNTTGISIENHTTGTVIGVQSSTTSVTGVQSTTTTASKVTLGTALSVPNVTDVDSVTVPIADSNATIIPIKDTNATNIPNVTDAGNGTASLTFEMDETDTKKLIISFSHTHTPPTIGTPISITGVQSSTTSVTGVTGTTTASKVTLGTAISIPNVTGVSDVTVPIKDTNATTVPIKNTSTSTFVTGTTHTITDNGHTHSIT